MSGRQLKYRFTPLAFHYLLSITVLLLSSCARPGVPKDTSTSGSISIAADYEYQPVTQAEIEVFQALYHNASIKPVFATEDSAFQLLMADSVRLVIASRKLLPSEENYFHTLKLYPEQMKVATDALALIVNKENTDTLLTLNRLKAIFGGQDSIWRHQTDVSGSHPKKSSPDISPERMSIVFDYANSGSSRYILQNLAGAKKLPDYCYALHGNTEVIEYVSKNKNALGVIGINWISNVYDTSVISHMNDITVIAVAKKDAPSPGDYFKPDKENILYGNYPLCRDMYIVSREAYTGLGSGFFSFVTSNRGQRIIYRDGLAPVTAISHTISY